MLTASQSRDADVASARLNFAVPTKSVVFVLLLLIATFLLLMPLTVLVTASFTPAGFLPFESSVLTWDNYIQVFRDQTNWVIAFNTVVYVTGSITVGFLISGILAWLTERTDMPLAATTRSLMFVGMSLPIIVMAFGWILLLNQGNGALNNLARHLFGLTGSPFNVYTMWAMIGITGIAVVPTMWVMFSSTLRNMDPELELAATVSGGSGWTVIRKVTIPLIIPGLMSAAIYMFVILLQVFDIPLTIGLTAHIPVMATRVYFLSKPEFGLTNYGAAASVGMLLLLMAMVLIYAYFRMTRASSRYQVISARGYRPSRIKLGRWRYAACGFVVLYWIAMFLPIAILLWTSFLPFYQTPSLAALERLTFQNYQLVWNNGMVRLAFTNTLVLMFGSATICMALSGLMSWFSLRSQIKGAKILDVMAFLPIAIPSIVMALAFLLFYMKTPLNGTLWVILIGHVTVFLAFGTRIMGATIMQIHPDLEHAVAVNGGTWWTTLRTVVLPLVLPSFLYGWLWVVTHSLKDVSFPIILLTMQNLVLSSALFMMWNFPDIPGASALAMLMMLGLLVIIVPAQIYMKRTRTEH